MRTSIVPRLRERVPASEPGPAEDRNDPVRRPRRLDGARCPAGSRGASACPRPLLRARRAIERHGGVVEKFIGDAAMAVFGIPRRTRTMPSGRSSRVRASEALAELSEELTGATSLQVRVGVNTGEVLVRAADSRRVLRHRGRGQHRGATRAGRLPGEVLIGEATYRLVQHCDRKRACRSVDLGGALGRASVSGSAASEKPSGLWARPPSSAGTTSWLGSKPHSQACRPSAGAVS